MNPPTEWSRRLCGHLLTRHQLHPLPLRPVFAARCDAGVGACVRFGRGHVDVASLMARRVKPEKTDKERLADLEAELREVLSHKQAETVMRKARAR